MKICPMCKNTVLEFKKNCHVLPRAWVKQTKAEGHNILMEFNTNTISLNKSDYADDYWCSDCETQSSKDDGYGAEVFIQRSSGKLHDVKGIKTDFKIISEVDQRKLKKFILSIAIRDHLARKLRKYELLLSEEEYEVLRSDYLGDHDQTAVVGCYVRESDPLSNSLSPPARTQKNDGISFQLFRFGFMVFFDHERPEIEYMSLKADGTMRLPILKAEQVGSLSAFPEAYQKILDNPSNAKQLDRINRKFPPDT